MTEQMSNSHTTDWEISINELLKNTCPPPASPRGSCTCIFRAHVLRDVDKAAFTPKIVSIGPLHYSVEHLKGMTKIKVNYLKHFLHHAAKTKSLLHEQSQHNSLEDKLKFLGWKKAEGNNPIETAANDNDIGEFRGILESLKNDIRSCYVEKDLNDVGCSQDRDFLTMIMVDAAFVIELFLRFHFRSGFPLLSIYLLLRIRCDLCLLENQLPFFVLKQLYNSAFGSYIPDIYPTFLELTCKFFSIFNVQKKEMNIIGEVDHFTDLLRVFYLPIPSSEDEKGSSSDNKKPNNSQSELSPDQLPTATELHAAGVKFRASESKCLLDISFSKVDGILEIPCLHLWDEIAVNLFRNLIALEQFHYLPRETHISDYFTFMDHLINTSRDVDLLKEKKIIKHLLGSNSEVAQLFNSLCKHIGKGVINKHLSDIIRDLNEYNDFCNRSKATLYDQYFSTPWKIASTIAAIILLVLTLAQTIMTAFTL